MSVIAKVSNLLAAEALRKEMPETLADSVRDVVDAFHATIRPLAPNVSAGPLANQFVLSTPGAHPAVETDLAKRLSDLDGIDAYAKPRTSAPF